MVYDVCKLEPKLYRIRRRKGRRRIEQLALSVERSGQSSPLISSNVQRPLRVSRSPSLLKMHMHSGINLLEDVPGTGPLIQRKRFCRIRIRMWLNKGAQSRHFFERLAC